MFGDESGWASEGWARCGGCWAGFSWRKEFEVAVDVAGVVVCGIPTEPYGREIGGGRPVRNMGNSGGGVTGICWALKGSGRDVAGTDAAMVGYGKWPEDLCMCVCTRFVPRRFSSRVFRAAGGTLLPQPGRFMEGGTCGSGVVQIII